ncbi:membrane integrity-associated transporter subunit PqiC [Rhizobium sp. TH2]|uniref:ABC-type transport auxiliary lipoprotein family protein n=1 Tax=Rhizobium sp. TH2 TaxID=2775403 RepID=UPI0021571A34|nr:ABC-type transport auxiliary lipoprotein family protein [Rhizobium sp. TH2]UVC10899.1 membrane integrity-associated transporter subunit PqiC [Rhizobium sp. TH2]
MSGMQRLVTALVLATSAMSLTGCLGGSADKDTFSLSAMPEVTGPSAKNRQILIPEPTALKALDSEQVVIRLSGVEIQYLSKARWSDRLPKMVQAKLVEAFENTGRLGGVGKPGEGLAIDFQIVTDIRAFQVETNGATHASIEISAKLLNDRNGTVRSQKVFAATVPVSGSDNRSYVAALDAAFAQVTSEIVIWTLKQI